jgi:hypothetical protein
METSVPTPLRPRPLAEFQTHGENPVTSLVINAGASTLRFLHVVNNTATAGFVQVHNAATLPADAVKPLLSRPIAANGEVLLEVPIYCSTGLTIVISTTLATKTISANAALVFAKFVKH